MTSDGVLARRASQLMSDEIADIVGIADRRLTGMRADASAQRLDLKIAVTWPSGRAWHDGS